MALKVTLRPGEKFVINGAVVVNGDRRATIVIQNKVAILRARDIMQPEEANTPAKRIYFPVMMMYLDDKDRRVYYLEFVRRITEFINVIQRPEIHKICTGIIENVNSGDYYQALMGCKRLFPVEEEMLTYDAAKS